MDTPPPGRADAFGSAVAMVRWAIPYVLLGAAVVAPVWLVMTLWRAIRRWRR